MLLTATLLDRSATAAGFVAAAIAVGGFLAHAVPILASWNEERIRKVTVFGGLWGVAGAAFVIVLSAILGRA
jgi:hypothetical protein